MMSLPCRKWWLNFNTHLIMLVMMYFMNNTYAILITNIYRPKIGYYGNCKSFNDFEICNPLVERLSKNHNSSNAKTRSRMVLHFMFINIKDTTSSLNNYEKINPHFHHLTLALNHPIFRNDAWPIFYNSNQRKVVNFGRISLNNKF